MSRIYSFTGAAGLLLFSPGLAAAQETQPHPHYGGHMWGDGMWGGGMVFGPLLMIFYIALLVAVVVIVVRWLSGTSLGGHLAPSQSADNALNILKERFARGEIDKDEFDERHQALKG